MNPKRKVLVIDDDVDLLRAVSTRLKANGFDPVIARDGLQAVAAARREKPDVILVDLGLPGGDGFSVIERIQQIGPLQMTPIIVLSARDPEGNRERSLALGAVAYLQKPVESAILISTIREALGEAPGSELAS